MAKDVKKFKVVSMNVGFGKKEYTIFRDFGGEWGCSRPIKYYKTKKGALKEISRRSKIKL